MKIGFNTTRLSRINFGAACPEKKIASIIERAKYEEILMNKKDLESLYSREQNRLISLCEAGVISYETYSKKIETLNERYLPSIKECSDKLSELANKG